MDEDIEKLNALLKMDEEGEEIVHLLNEMLVDSKKRNTLLIKLNEIRKEMSTLSSELKLTKSEEMVRSIVRDNRERNCVVHNSGRLKVLRHC